MDIVLCDFEYARKCSGQSTEEQMKSWIDRAYQNMCPEILELVLKSDERKHQPEAQQQAHSKLANLSEKKSDIF